MEPTGKREETQMHFAGERAGNYEMVPSYNFVGQGQGSYMQETVTTYSGWRVAPQGLVACGVISVLLLAALLLLWWMISLKTMVQATETTTSSTTTSRSTAPLHFDCDEGLLNWEIDWDATKQDWCCQTTGRACNSVPFDCSEGWDDLQGSYWPVDKQAWCCEHYARGCPTSSTFTTTRTTVTRPTTGPPTTTTAMATTWVMVPIAAKYDCTEDATWATSWEDAKQQWCCAHTGRGCIEPPPADPFVCTAGLRWVHLWSTDKKDWCCVHKQLGCVVDAPPGAR